MPAAAIPVAASLAAPAVGAAGASALGFTGASALAPWLTAAAGGALTGGLGSYIMGQDPMKGALFGGIGGGLAGGIPNGFGSASDVANAANAAQAAAPEAISPAMAAADPSLANPVAASAASNAAADTAKTGSLLGSMGKIGPFAALTLGSLALNKATAPKTIDTSSKIGDDYRQPLPMNRGYVPVDPNSFLTNSPNRTYFNNVNPQVQYAKGGSVRCMADGGSIPEDDHTNAMLDSIAAEGRNALDSGAPASHPAVKAFISTFGDPAEAEVRRAIASRSMGHSRKYARGGRISCMAKGGAMMPMGADMGGMPDASVGMPQSGMPVNGPGDGMQDKIPAKLSDGEFVVSAPVVSALGNGSNRAGAKKLNKLQTSVHKRHFSGGKPKKALGLSSYMH